MEESSRPVSANRALRAAVAAALCVGVVSIPPVRAETAPHTLVGVWALNKNLSDMPDERIEGSASSRPQQGGGYGHGGRGRGGYGGGGFPSGGGHAISGSPGKITETYSVDTDHHELMVITRIEPSEHQDRTRVFHRLYSAEVR